MEEAISDPSGFEVVLTDECWHHITARHPEMQPFKHLVVETIERADRIYLGKRDSTRRICQKRYESVPGIGNSVDVLVFVDGQSGHVATAYFRAVSFRGLGQQIWPSN